MEKLLISQQTPMTLSASRELRHHLGELIYVVIKEPALCRRILLCLSEVLNNLALHAAPATRDKDDLVARSMTMRFSQVKNNWCLEISDDGDPWDPTNYELPVVTKEEPRLNSSGRGIELLRSQCDQLQYWPGENNDNNRLQLSWEGTEKLQASILIVDDDTSLLRLYATYLSKRFKVNTAVSAHQAIEKLKHEAIDLVVSDINMPGMSGLGLREKLQRNEHTETLPFIFLSAHDNAHLQQHANSLGVDDYLHKPINKQRLTGSIERVLARSKKIRQQMAKRLNKNITDSLPVKLPRQVNGWRLAVDQKNSGAGGGDLLVHRTGKRNFQLLLADIMGHDESAKFFAHACGAYLHGLLQAQENANNAAALLEKLSNFALQDHILANITLTCSSTILLPRGRIKLASAGHPPPLRIDKKGVTPITTGGMLPGLIKHTRYQDTNIRLGVGERLALYTDGLFDCSADPLIRDEIEKAVISALVTTLSLPIELALSKVMSTFENLAGTTLKDDVLLLLLERTH